MKISALVACAAMTFVPCCTPHIKQEKRSCVSRCGLLFEGEPNGSMSCDILQHAEDTVLDAYDKNLCNEDPRFCRKAACSALFGWQLTTGEEVVGTEDGSQFYVGYSQCRSKVMFLCANQDWRHGSFPHELAHVVQNCEPSSEWTETEREADLGPGHAGWTEHNVYGTIDEIRKGKD